MLHPSWNHARVGLNERRHSLMYWWCTNTCNVRVHLYTQVIKISNKYCYKSPSMYMVLMHVRLWSTFPYYNIIQIFTGKDIGNAITKNYTRSFLMTASIQPRQKTWAQRVMMGWFRESRQMAHSSSDPEFRTIIRVSTSFCLRASFIPASPQASTSSTTK